MRTFRGQQHSDQSFVFPQPFRVSTPVLAGRTFADVPCLTALAVISAVGAIYVLRARRCVRLALP